MIVSANSQAEKVLFEQLLDNSLCSLRMRANENPKRYGTLLGSKLETEIVDVLKETSKNTPFENSIELVSGQKFPDIVAKKMYGIEVKTTNQNHWKTTGSSVTEGTRVNDVERIWLLFGKMCNPIEFRCRPYEECLSEVVVTHSPRYLIDMDLQQGATFFDKINVPYDNLRTQHDPIRTVVAYYKKQLKAGERLWWMGDDSQNSASNIVIRLWNNLERKEQERLKLKGYVMFPELLGTRNDKFNRFVLWLATQSIVCPNIRDQFTAGGQGEIELQGKHFTKIPQIILRFFQNFEKIKQLLYEISNDELSDAWNCPIGDFTDRMYIWKQKVLCQNSSEVLKILLR